MYFVWFLFGFSEVLLSIFNKVLLLIFNKMFLIYLFSHVLRTRMVLCLNGKHIEMSIRMIPSVGSLLLAEMNNEDWVKTTSIHLEN